MDFKNEPLPGVVNEAVVALHVVEAQEKHTGTVIFLHGSGDAGSSFVHYARVLNREPELKHLKWILPSAKTRRCTAFGGSVMPLWFDILQFRDLSAGPWDEAGMLESVEAIHGLIRHEITANGIPPHRIVLAGLSQGSATAVWSAISFPDAKLAGVCGLAGRLPAKELLQTALPIPTDEHLALTLRWLGQRISPHAKDLPYYLAHSDRDTTVPLEAGSKVVMEFLKNVVGVPDAGDEDAPPAGVNFALYPGRPHFLVADPEVWHDVGGWLKKLSPKTEHTG